MHCPCARASDVGWMKANTLSLFSSLFSSLLFHLSATDKHITNTCQCHFTGDTYLLLYTIYNPSPFFTLHFPKHYLLNHTSLTLFPIQTSLIPSLQNKYCLNHFSKIIFLFNYVYFLRSFFLYSLPNINTLF